MKLFIIMDQIRAKKIARALEGKQVGGWLIQGYEGNGKSAVILSAYRNKRRVALKIFDPDLVGLYGYRTQLALVQTEMKLIDKKHANLIEIIDGGKCNETNYLFVAMSYLQGSNLSEKISLLPRERIFPLIKQVASAAKFLEDNGLVHRDIKPENIFTSDDLNQAILIDLGVLGSIGLSEITDEKKQKIFFGTLRYSPPELFLGKEKNNLEGWRAITFYQLGAVLHDMIMRRPIFHIYADPYNELVDAICNIIPEITAGDLDPSLISLAKNCLLKDPKDRLSLVSWNDFL